MCFLPKASATREGAISGAGQAVSWLALFFCSVISLNAQMAYLGEGGDGLPRPKTTPTVLDGSDQLSEWFAFHWAAEGYLMPAWKDIFRWDAYLEKVTDGRPKKFDACYYNDGTEFLACGMVVEDPDDNEQPVVVMNPMPGSMVIIHSIKREMIAGYLRPKGKQ
jgi:hypothetical protein